MKRFFSIAALIVTAAIFAENCSPSLYSQTKIMKKSKQILADSGDYYVGKWIMRDKRVSLDTLVKICSPNISQYDSVRNAIFNSIAEVNDTRILELMSVKLVSGNPLEILAASAYIYRYYGIEMKVGQDVPLASLLILFHSTADNLKKRNSPYYKSIEQKANIAQTFPKSEDLYREFIVNKDLSFPARSWFVESLLENPDREIVATFLLDLEIELSEEDPILNSVKNVIYTLMNRGAQGDWIP